MYTDEFRDLIVEARDAVERLLDASRHDSWVCLRGGYGEIRRALEVEEKLNELDRLREEAEQTQPDLQPERGRCDERRDRCERKRAWRRSPRDVRENLVLDVLGDDSLLVRELVDRMNARLEQAEPGVHPVYKLLWEGHVRPLLNRMTESGQLARDPEPFKGRFRYRYFRKPGLAGPIADLERAYHDDSEPAA